MIRRTGTILPYESLSRWLDNSPEWNFAVFILYLVSCLFSAAALSIVHVMVGLCTTTTNNRDIDKIREGIAEKVSHFLWLIMGFFICVSLAFYYGWELSLVVISYVPIVMVTNAIISKVL